MIVWNDNPTRTSCIVIDQGANLVVPKGVRLNNYSEIIVKNGTLTIEDMDSYNGATGLLRIGPSGKVIAPEFDASMYKDCGANAVVLANDKTYTFDGQSWS